jgi:hypothetical protein
VCQSFLPYCPQERKKWKAVILYTQRAKLETQREVEWMTTIYPDDLDPYPGSFLKANLEEKFERACTVLAEEYGAQGDEISRVETLNNIVRANTQCQSSTLSKSSANCKNGGEN